MQLSIEYESRTIPFQLEYRKRRTLEIRIQPPNHIRVVAPTGLSKEAVVRQVMTKAGWICKKLSEYEGINLNLEKKEYKDGALFLLLGKYYPLRIVDAVYKPRVKFTENYLCVYTCVCEEEKLKLAIEKWYRLTVAGIVEDRIKYYQQFFNEKPTAIVIKDQKKRWGSCTSERKLLFNWRLVMAPLPVIDYVVVHEMCHMKHMNHSKEFWNLVEDILPDYKERKNWLKLNGMLIDFE